MNHVYWKIFIFNWTILTIFSFPEYCFIHEYWVPPHKSLISAWTSPLFVGFFWFSYILIWCSPNLYWYQLQLYIYPEVLLRSIYVFYQNIDFILVLLYMVLKAMSSLFKYFYSLPFLHWDSNESIYIMLERGNNHKICWYSY